MTGALPLWVLLAFGFSFCGAVIIGYNQWAQVDGRKLVVLRVGGVWPLALLSLLVWPWPQEVMFYVVAAGMGVLLAYTDTLLFNAAARHGGRLTALYVPMKMLMGFTLWALFEPQTLLPLLSEPWRAGMLTAGFGLCGGALMFIRRVDASWVALLAMVPVAALYAVGDVVAKEALSEPDALAGLALVAGHTVAYLAVSSTAGSAFAVAMGGRKGFSFTRQELLKSVLFGAILLSGLVVMLMAIALSPNPGYVAAITMLSALWLAVLGWWQRGERNNWWAGIALLAGAIAVAVATG
ncbi:MAG: hypothetical protein GC129_04460 [Proteobacteria bacterium]|nr:hypothetical protein [Pseudomonadota bacterium]